MADHAHIIPVSQRAEETRANILAAALVSFLIALSVYGLGSSDPVTTGHAYALEVVR